MNSRESFKRFVWLIGSCSLLGLGACSSTSLDLHELKLYGIPLTPGLSPQEVVHVIGPPQEEGRSRRWFWRPPRLYMKYYSKGMEIAFDSEGNTYDPVSARFVRAYVFLRPEAQYSAFAGKISHGIDAAWDLQRLEKALGPPEKTRTVGSELEWTYWEQRQFQLVFIAETSTRKLKALMIIRHDRDRPK